MLRLRVAILGYGAVAHEHARVLCSSPDAELVAVVGPRREKAEAFSASHGRAPVLADLEAARKAVTVDAVIIASPTDLHLPHARAAVDAGLHTLIEFPLHAGPDEIAPLFETTQRTGLVLAVAHTSRFIWSFRRAKELIDGGYLGRCKSVSYLRLLCRPPRTGPGGRERTWNDDVLVHHSAHLLDLCHYWFGPDMTPVGVVAPTERSGRRNCGLLLRGPDAMPINANLTYDASYDALHVILIMERAVIDIDGFARLRINGIDEPTGRPETDDDAYRNAIKCQDTAFLAAAAGTQRFPVSSKDTRQLNETLNRALQLAETCQNIAKA